MKSDAAKDRELFRRLADGLLSLEEFTAVEERLLTDSTFRERYVRAVDLEANLCEAFNLPGTYSQPSERAKPPVGLIALAATSALILVGIVGWLSWVSRTSPPPAEFYGNVVQEMRPVAIVTRATADAACATFPFRHGMRIKPGVLSVPCGEVQVEFLNGAQINVEGPAELNIGSVSSATLNFGRIAARIPPGARGFVLNTPDAAIVDLGTEFAVSVSRQGGSEVHVTDGEVDVSLLGSDGSTLMNEQVSEPASLRVTRNSGGLEQIESPSVTLPVIHAQIADPLEVPDAYAAAVRASRPIIHWRFDRLVDGRVPNEIEPRWSGVIHPAPDDPSAIVIRDGVARFDGGNKRRRIEPDEPIPGINRDSFTFEFWVSPDYFHWATLVSVVPVESVDRNMHLSLIELPYKCSLVYIPGSFRFLHRYPAGDHGGFNLFSNGDCTPGLWHHLAAIKTPTDLKLYLNGELVRHVPGPVAGDDAPYRFLVGALYEAGSRQLTGAIDEFALYLRALSGEEIAEHYRVMGAVGTQD